MRLKAKLAGMFPPLKWSKEIQPLKSIVEREDAASLTADDVLGIIREMDERSQRKMAIVLQFPFAQRTSKSWPEHLFIKSVRTALQEANQDLSCKRRIILAILQEIEPILNREAKDLMLLSRQIPELTAKYGAWHIYWAAYLHPERDHSSDQWKADLQTLRDLASNDLPSQAADTVRETAASASSMPAEVADGDSDSPLVDQLHRDPRKITVLEAKLHKETALRQKLELENAGQGKTIRQHERRIELLEHRLNIEKQRAEQGERRAAVTEQRIYDEQQLRREDQAKWRSERETLLRQVRQHERAVDESRLAFERLEREHQRFRDTAHQWQLALQSPDGLAERLDKRLRAELSQLARTLASNDEDHDRHDNHDRHNKHDRQRQNRTQRQDMRTILDLLDAIEAYQESKSGHKIAERTSVSAENAITAQDPSVDSSLPQRMRSDGENTARTSVSTQDHLEQTTGQPPNSTPTGTAHTKNTIHTTGITHTTGTVHMTGTTHTTDNVQTTGTAHTTNNIHTTGNTHTTDTVHTTGSVHTASNVHTGTFYRRDHGGYIILDNGGTFNLPESLVNTLELQHEAEVQCRPYTQENGSVYYEVEILFQGDDAYAPIVQYDGYVQLGEHHVYYCVDLNDPTNRFPLHRKDFEIQQPADGTPCTFNVSIDGQFARLSRLYRDFEITEGGQDSSSQVRQRTSDRNRKDPRAPVQKPEPFLEGCTITILGGQRKWFEDIVTEAGAELVHDTGETPDRITAALRRSHALFMLLTSISHRASWEGIEIAKAHGIPHFTIQGSKSNLRMLLWDNQELIRSGSSE